MQVAAARFLDVFSLCLSQNSVFSGSLDKLVLARPSSSGFMRSIAELKAITDDSVPLDVRNRKMLYMPENEQTEYELPHLPPWFVNVGSQNLYPALAGILRLIARSFFAGRFGLSVRLFIFFIILFLWAKLNPSQSFFSLPRLSN